MRVVFAGTPEFAAAALSALHAAGHEIVRVLTQPDRPAGRGLAMQASAVKTLAIRMGVPVSQPLGLRLDGRFAADAQLAQQELMAAGADVMVVAAYGLILPPWVLQIPRWGCMNIHASLLPRWRGAAPIHRAIEAGDRVSGITIMQMDAGLDTGDMLMQLQEPIRPEDTTATLHDRLALLGGQLMVQTLAQAQVGALHAVPQPDSGVTYAHKIDKRESRIDWAEAADVIERRVRAFDPFPGCTFEWQGQTVKLWRAAVHPAMQAPVGTLVALPGAKRGLVCGQGVLEPLVVQRAGGRRITFAQFLQ